MSAPEEDTEMAPVAEEVDVLAADENEELDYEPSTEKTDKVELPSIRRRKVRETFGGGDAHRKLLYGRNFEPISRRPRTRL